MFIRVRSIRHAKDGSKLCEALANKCKNKAKYSVDSDIGKMYVCPMHKKFTMRHKELHGRVIEKLK